MSERDSDRDTPLPWGYIGPEGVFIPLPKVPMLLAGLGPPPFDVELPSGEVRHIIEQPDQIAPVERRPDATEAAG